jgi:hypothetical protein
MFTVRKTADQKRVKRLDRSVVYAHP